MFANSPGTDLRLWENLLPLLPQGLRRVRFDKRGHGLSDIAAGVSIDGFADDAIALIERLKLADAVFLGLSIVGLITQAVAAKRPVLLRAIMLSNTAARIGSPESWAQRIDAVEQHGLESIADGVMERRRASAFRATPQLAAWRNMLVRTPAGGCLAACRAIVAADFTQRASKLDLPALVIAGDADGSTPPDIVKATGGLIKGAQYHFISGAADLPFVENPQAYAAISTRFLKETVVV